MVSVSLVVQIVLQPLSIIWTPIKGIPIRESAFRRVGASVISYHTHTRQSIRKGNRVDQTRSHSVNIQRVLILSELYGAGFGISPAVFGSGMDSPTHSHAMTQTPAQAKKRTSANKFTRKHFVTIKRSFTQHRANRRSENVALKSDITGTEKRNSATYSGCICGSPCGNIRTYALEDCPEGLQSFGLNAHRHD